MSLQPKQLIPVSAMARRLHVPVRWLRGEAEDGRIPHVKAETAILFHPETVERVLIERAQREGITNQPGGVTEDR